MLTSNNLNKKFLTDSPKGQGSKNRKLCDSEESIKNREHFGNIVMKLMVFILEF